ncbi:structural protein [Roseomonas frigidaquae]|uniref:Structural protein n=1 Tax=Falsiroseomonas frigidaquae TaxID=487318 RepID=A0ABX1ESK0_9PROT|nr:structural protein [Falsiroseomonas frigidaquae]NKE43596.1 structural protein [Falsiroseomonas frigidaquae]
MAQPRLEESRGYRNRNPGNIDYVPANRWQGQIGLGDTWLPVERRRFARFESHEYGIRALAMLLTTYQDRHGLRTVRGIINRWAPPKENDTSAYVRGVAAALGVDPDQVIDLHRYETMRPMVEAIIRHELGGLPYAPAVIDEGLRRAGLVRPVATMLEAAATGTGRGASSVATAVAVAAPAASVISSLGGLPQWTGVALIVAVAVVALSVILTLRKDRGEAPA